MAAGDPYLCAALALTLGLMVGVIRLVASLMQLGGIADFRSRPILMGFLHGIAIALILDLIPVSQIDVTGWHTLIELTRELDVEEIRLSFAGRKSEMPDFAQRERIDDEFLSGRNYLTIELVVAAFQTEFGKPKEDASEKRLRIEPEVPA